MLVFKQLFTFIKAGCTVDLFDLFGLVCFANKNEKCPLSYSCFQTSQTGGQPYSDTSPLKCSLVEPYLSGVHENGDAVEPVVANSRRFDGQNLEVVFGLVADVLLRDGLHHRAVLQPAANQQVDLVQRSPGANVIDLFTVVICEFS
jgi:hypothetical protein